MDTQEKPAIPGLPLSSRRMFLGLAAAGGAAMAAGPSLAALDEFGGWPDSFGALHDMTLCVGCRRCEEACNRANRLTPPEKPFDDETVFETIRRPTAAAYTVVNRYTDPELGDLIAFRKTQCNHCLEPACATACPAHAYSTTLEGAVVYDENLCFGCRYCMVACPHRVPAFRYDSPTEPKIVKCDFCHQRIKDGLLPACAEACPTGALLFGKRSDLLMIAKRRIGKNPKDYQNHVYGEAEAGGSAWLYLSPAPFEELGFAAHLPKKPLIELTQGYLAYVPIVLTVWPALFGMFYSAVKSRSPAPPAPSIPPSRPEYVEEGVTFPRWLFGKLMMGMSFKEYALSLATPLYGFFALILSVGVGLLGLRFLQGLGAVTHSSDTDPWGLLIGWGLFVGVPFSATGFVITTAYYIFGYKPLKPYVRISVLCGLLGYLFAVIYLLIDLGRPWRIYYPMVISFGPASVLFLVAWHVALYTTVQALEFSPTALEWLAARRVKRWAMSVTVAMTIFGIILSTLHQSALGAMFLLTPGKIHPLWYSPYLPVFYLASSIYAALAFVILALWLTARLAPARCGKEYMDNLDSVTLALANGAAVAMYVYCALKVIGLAHGGLWGHLGSGYGYLYLAEVAGLALVPAALYTLAVKMNSPVLARWTSLLALLGIVVNRLNVSMVAFNWDIPGHLASIVPPWTEFGIAAMVTVVHILVFAWIVNRMPVAREEGGEPFRASA